MNAQGGIRVLVVDDHPLVREDVTSVLAGRDDITVVGAADGAIEALDRCGHGDVDVVLMDLAMPDIDGVTATALVHQRYPDIQIIVLTGYGQDISMRAALQAGASAFLVKTVDADALADAIRGVTRGRSTFSTEFMPQLLAEPDDARLGSDLTPRQHDILALLADGRTNKCIASELGLTEGTVRIYVSTILAKLHVANRTEATVVAIREGLVEARSSKPGPPNDTARR